MDNLIADRDEDQDILVAKTADGTLDIVQTGQKVKFNAGTTVLTFSPSRDDRVSGSTPQGVSAGVIPT